ncbi:MAG: hypothetical protein FWB85_02950 [Chitinispirillia bacterium]|nr:hypothetical protein [Chitinispirillia bacterium]
MVKRTMFVLCAAVLLMSALTTCRKAQSGQFAGGRDCCTDTKGKVQMGWSAEMPPEAAKLLENYVSNLSANNGPLFAQVFNLLSDSVRVRDLTVGRAVPKYKFKHVFLNAYPDTVPFCEIIEPVGEWYAPILFGGSPQYELSLRQLDGKWEISAISSISRVGDSMWDLLEEFYAKSAEVSPVLFTFEQERYLYFPQLGPRKIHYLRHGSAESDPLAAVLPGTISTPGDSKNVMEHWKRQGHDEVGRTVTYEEWCALMGYKCEEGA